MAMAQPGELQASSAAAQRANLQGKATRVRGSGLAQGPAKYTLNKGTLTMHILSCNSDYQEADLREGTVVNRKGAKELVDKTNVDRDWDKHGNNHAIQASGSSMKRPITLQGADEGKTNSQSRGLNLSVSWRCLRQRLLKMESIKHALIIIEHIMNVGA